MQLGNIRQSLLSMFINNILPIFFLIIPIMAASVMAAGSFVGEKEKRTLETLFYSPLSLKQIFNAKILASFILSIMVSFVSFIIMTFVIEIELVLTLGGIILPNISWLFVMFLLFEVP